MQTARGVWISRFVRFAIAAAALTWLWLETDWGHLRRVLAEADWRLVLIGAACFGPAPFLLAFRLKLLLGVQGIDLRFGRVVRAAFASNFVTHALPLGTGGGDTVKAYDIARQTPKKHEAITAILFDRLIGMGGLLSLSGIMVLLDWNNPAFEQYGRPIALAILLLACGLVIAFSRRIRRFLQVERILAALPFGAHLTRMDRAVFAFRSRPRTIGACWALTFILQINSVAVMFLIGWALGLVGDSPLSAAVVYLAYTPICFLTGALPIGVMEVAFAELLAGAGNLGTREAAISLSFMGRIVQLLWAVPGAWFVLASRPPTLAGPSPEVVEQLVVEASAEEHAPPVS